VVSDSEKQTSDIDGDVITNTLNTGLDINNNDDQDENLRISIFNNEFFNACEKQFKEWKIEHWPYYESVFCCKFIPSKMRSDTIKAAMKAIGTKIIESEQEVFRNVLSHKCCLPKSHEGTCQAKIHEKAFTNSTINSKLNWVFITPGNDDYIFKNRCTRLFPIRFSDDDEKRIRNKDKKLKCAIPIKDASTPEFIMSCYVDYLTLFVNVKGFEMYIEPDNNYYKLMKPVLEHHKTNLELFFKSFNRNIFDKSGFTICPVTGIPFTVEDLLSSDIHKPNNVQLGHIHPRSCEQYTIRGKNVLLMSREGNRIIGDNNFLEDEWIDVLKRIVDFQNHIKKI
jgi:hypothetical protein